MTEFKVDIDDGDVMVVPEMDHESAQRMMKYLSDYMSSKRLENIMQERDNRLNIVKMLVMKHFKGRCFADYTYHGWVEILKEEIFKKLDEEFSPYIDIDRSDVTKADERVWFESMTEVNIGHAQLSERGIIDSRARELISVSNDINVSVRRHVGYTTNPSFSVVRHGILVSVRIDKELVFNREYACP